MIDTLPMQHPPTLLSSQHKPLLHQQLQVMQTEPTSSNATPVGSLSPSLVAKNDCADKIKTVKPWRLTPPLKKRHVRVALPEMVDEDTIAIGPLTTTTTIYVKKQTSTKKIVPVKAKKTKKSVRFAKVIKTRTLKKERTTNMTPMERSSMWYQNREYAEIDRNSVRDIQAFLQVGGDFNQLPSDQYCLRGLEMKTSPHIHRLRLLRANITVRAVLDQQKYSSNSSNNKSEEAIAMVSRQYTQQAQNRARELGLIDSIEAKRSYR